MQTSFPPGRGWFSKFGWWIILAATLGPGLGGGPLHADQIIYDDALRNGWQNWSWATVNLANPAPVHSGPASISVVAGNWSALFLGTAAMDVSPFTHLTFWINGGAQGGQAVQVQGMLGANNAQAPVPIGPLPANAWRQVTLSLADLGVDGQPNFTGFWLQAQTAGTLPVFYVDDVALVTLPIPVITNAPVSIAVNAAAGRHAISPLIYGVAFAGSSNVLRDLNVPLHRSGGNGTTRYNWRLNASNRGSDWYFESIPESSGATGGAGDDFIQTSLAGGAQPMLTIPIIGWVAQLGPNREHLASYDTGKYGPQTKTDPYWSAAGNGTARTGGNITNNDPRDANVPSNPDFQAGWVRQLTNRWGTATAGGVRYYLMDNEWSLWQSTHRDVHPTGATMDEVLDDFCNYSAMVKSIDPAALVAGPEEWGWPGYLYSGADQQWAGLHNDGNPADYPDRRAHGGQDFGPWFLAQTRQRSLTAGRRLLDIFTLHCYPQAGRVSGDAADPATVRLRNESTRQFWDTNYVDPGWIHSVIALIPRMKSWVAANDPGTQTGITEYNWGAERSINGATAQADVLGIFGREGLDLATRWTTPDAATPTYKAIKLYRNYDGHGSTFGDTSIQTTVPNPDTLAAFGALRSGDGALTLLIINKEPNHATPVNADLAGFPAAGVAQRWQLTAANVITRLADLPFADHRLSDLVPAQSVTLYILAAR